MNMRSQPEGLEFLSNVTNSTLDLIPDMDLRNSSQAIASMIASSGNYQYEWPVFAGTATGLLSILPFTLAVGSIMRVTVVSVVRYAKYWRAVTLLGGGFFLLAFLTTSIVGYMIPYLIYGYWGANGVVLLTLLYLVYQSWSEGKGRFFWTTQLVITAICFPLDMLGLGFFLMIIPWLWLGLFNAWVRQWWWAALFARWR